MPALVAPVYWLEKELLLNADDDIQTLNSCETVDQRTGTLGGLDVCEADAVAFGFRPVYGALIARYIDTLGLSALFYISGGGESERRNGSQEEGREEPHGEDAGVLYSVVASALIYAGATYKHAYASHGGKD